MNELGKFLDDYMKMHDMSLNEFARKADVGKATVSRLIHEEHPPAPSASVLLKLALFTKQNPGDLLHLFLSWNQPKPARVAILNQWIEALSADKRAMIDRLILSLIEGEQERNNTK